MDHWFLEMTFLWTAWRTSMSNRIFLPHFSFAIQSFRDFIGQTTGCPTSQRIVRLNFSNQGGHRADHNLTRPWWELLLIANTSHSLDPNKMPLASCSIALIRQVHYTRFVLISLNLIVSKVLTEHFQYQFGDSTPRSSGSRVRYLMTHL